MEVDFENEHDKEKFVNWANSKEKNKSENMERMRKEFKQIRHLRNVITPKVVNGKLLLDRDNQLHNYIMDEDL